MTDGVSPSEAVQRFDCSGCDAEAPGGELVGVEVMEFSLGHADSDAYSSGRKRFRLCWDCYRDQLEWLYDHSYNPSMLGPAGFWCSDCGEKMESTDPVVSVDLYFGRKPIRTADFSWIFDKVCYYRSRGDLDAPR